MENVATTGANPSLPVPVRAPGPGLGLRKTVCRQRVAAGNPAGMTTKEFDMLPLGAPVRG